jgi:hypothetical protein
MVGSRAEVHFLGEGQEEDQEHRVRNHLRKQDEKHQNKVEHESKVCEKY